MTEYSNWVKEMKRKDNLLKENNFLKRILEEYDFVEEVGDNGMTEKRFTDIEHDFENARIRCKDNGMFMLYAIYEDDDGLQTLGDLLNNQEEEINELKTRNKRQYDLLTKITDFMIKRDWKGLEEIVEDWEESDRLLRTEWGNCCNLDYWEEMK